MLITPLSRRLQAGMIALQSFSREVKMNKYRRTEITAFRRRVSLVSGEHKAVTQTDEGVSINDADTQEPIETESEEGQRLLSEAMRMLDAKISKQASY
jgi:hypothetical protein